MADTTAKLTITEFGNPVLRKKAKQLTPAQIKSKKIQTLIADMQELAKSGEYGVGLAAPQVGQSVALSVITIRPTPSHKGRKKLDKVIVNPSYMGVGLPEPHWEGCLSFGKEEATAFAQVPRFKKIKAEYFDEKGKQHSEELTGFEAHVFQHETDHLNGILFVDKVEDSTTWMTASEYRKMLAKEPAIDK